jgi:hypothetical protein
MASLKKNSLYTYKLLAVKIKCKNNVNVGNDRILCAKNGT